MRVQEQSRALTLTYDLRLRDVARRCARPDAFLSRHMFRRESRRTRRLVRPEWIDWLCEAECAWFRQARRWQEKGQGPRAPALLDGWTTRLALRRRPSPTSRRARPLAPPAGRDSRTGVCAVRHDNRVVTDRIAHGE